MADAEAAAMSPKAYQNMTDPAQIDAARHRMALRIEELTGQTPPPMDNAGAAAGGQNSDNGSAVGGNGVDPGSATPAPGSSSGGSGGCSAVGGGRAQATPFMLLLVLLGGLGALGRLGLARRRRAQVARAQRSW
jgi:hypothetical protein